MFRSALFQCWIAVFLTGFLCLEVRAGSVDSLITLLDGSKGRARMGLLFDIVRTIDANDPAQALGYGEEALELAKKMKEDSLIGTAHQLIGVAHYNAGDYPEALQAYETSLPFLKDSSNLNLLSKSYNNIGAVYDETGDYDKALSYYFKSLKIKENNKDSTQLAVAYNNIAVVYYNLADLDKCVEYLKKTLAIDEAIGTPDDMAYSINNIASVYYRKKDYQTALQYFFRSYEIRKKQKDRHTIATSLSNIGNVYTKTRDYDKAFEYNQKALEIRESIGDKLGVAKSHQSLGNIYKSTKQHRRSLERHFMALDMAKSLEARPLIREVYLDISIVYEESGDPANALKYYKKYKLLQDSIFDLEKAEQLAELETLYETEKKEARIDLLQKEQEVSRLRIKQQSVVLYSSLSGIALLIIVALILYNRYQLKQKANRLLERKNDEIKAQRDEISIQKKHLTDSIQYAKRLQQAVFPDLAYIHSILEDAFILFEPRDIVSGDFYWFHEQKGKIYIAAVDCTGHGVPGAFVSMLGINHLNHLIKEKGMEDPGEILSALNVAVKEGFYRESAEVTTRDGMDIAMCVWDRSSANGGVLKFAGAFRPLLQIGSNELVEYKGDKTPIGGHSRDGFQFTTREITVRKNDMIYLFTDGYADQFGGKENLPAGQAVLPNRQAGKKFMTKRLKQFLLDHHHLPLAEQKNRLEQNLKEWQGNNDRIDDVLIIGFKI